ncbi:MAG TPA: CHRD domain-containing protein [Stellaceae bacterium]
MGARLSGYEETPSILTPATGTFEASVNDNQELAFTLRYSGLSASVTAAHIHFAKHNVAGAIVAFLCGGGSKPACPQDGAVTGTVAASDIIAVDQQGIPGGSFEALVDAIVSNSAYVNVHTTAHPAGEIRGQVRF